MTVPLFDAQAGFGGSDPGDKEIVAAEEWLEEMGRLEISRALVRTAPDGLDSDVPAANRALFQACEMGTRRSCAESGPGALPKAKARSKSNRRVPILVPCPTVVTSGGYDLPTEEEQVADFVARGAGAAFVRPKKDGWLLAEWACRRLFGALEDSRVPALCLEREVTPEELADLAGRHPRLPFILAGVGYRSQRVLVPLLESFPNVFLSIGSTYTIHRGIEQFVEKVGAGRLLFGTGFPEVVPMMAVTMLTYADVSEEEKALIGSGNMERLFQEIER